ILISLHDAGGCAHRALTGQISPGALANSPTVSSEDATAESRNTHIGDDYNPYLRMPSTVVLPLERIPASSVEGHPLLSSLMHQYITPEGKAFAILSRSWGGSFPNASVRFLQGDE
ncbi:hypothetical protein AB0M50_28270, partial [Nonomuraea fuscirosea]|uniref:hypothetical protein n=1 Tax=Nonomuraea fuscirosea TaxID=1291556 RepID=UPI003418F194